VSPKSKKGVILERYEFGFDSLEAMHVMSLKFLRNINRFELKIREVPFSNSHRHGSDFGNRHSELKVSETESAKQFNCHVNINMHQFSVTINVNY